MTAADAAVQCTRLTRRFGEISAVSALDLTVRRGEVFGLLGHNGAGKTTTIRLLNGLLRPHAGRATVLGRDPTVDGPAVRARTGVLTETPSLDERLSARTNLEIYAELYRVPRGLIGKRVDELLDTFGLSSRADAKVRDYSKGMKQRLAVARTLLHDPELLFFDEPTAGLDPVAAKQVHDLITSLSAAEHRTVILCTHNLVEAQRLCHRVAVLQRGRLLACGTPAELAARWDEALGLTLQLRPEQQQAALELLTSLFPTSAPAVIGPGELRLEHAPRERTPELLRRLLDAGIDVFAVRPDEPSLERVYFALHHAPRTVTAAAAHETPESPRR